MPGYGGLVPDSFRYDGFEIRDSSVSCRYSLGDLRFVEQVSLSSPLSDTDPATRAAARLVFLLAGVSYYKTSAPPVIDFGEHALTPAERTFLREFYLQGLGEFSYRNDLELEFEIRAPQAGSEPADYRPAPGRPLVPFGGGIDSIVSVAQVRSQFEDVALFVSSPGGALFDAIEAPAARSGLPIVRATRTIDAQVLRSRELGFRNGHVPVTGILSAVAVLAAVSTGRDAVVMSNERSASVPTLVLADRSINHQYSKSWDFERAFSAIAEESLGPELAYFSLLRPYSELWVAERFSRLRQYHHVFRSCNRAFHIDPAARLDHWCGHCDKCCFIDLVLAPFLTPGELTAIFGGSEPLRNEDLADQFRALLGLLPDRKPFECVGDIDECRAAVTLAARRPDRAKDAMIKLLAGQSATGLEIAQLLVSTPPHAIPDEYSPESLVV
jgi:UDP-N-acetyl-alpha-D-muramoyl-L-alanyl-L-glutamate epimerase